MDSVERAQKAIAKMLSEDRVSPALGMRLKHVEPGQAIVTMTVRDDMCNGHNIAHGGIIFSLADTCFACACNSYNVVTVAADCSISYVRPALAGDILTATAMERSKGRTRAVYDVEISNQNDQLVALFRGQAIGRGEHIIKDLDPN